MFSLNPFLLLQDQPFDPPDHWWLKKSPGAVAEVISTVGSASG